MLPRKLAVELRRDPPGPYGRGRGQRTRNVDPAGVVYLDSRKNTLILDLLFLAAGFVF